MIVGTGIDIMEIERVEAGLKQFGNRFKARFFTRDEQAYCDALALPAQHYAARFAAKEAFSKALGYGIAQGVRWVDIEVAREEFGRPVLTLHGKAKQLFERSGKLRIWLSLSHTRTIATAMVVIESQ
ncbi:MAG: holo-ACP synthase [Candidatus Sumerlaeota bacterium]